MPELPEVETIARQLRQRGLENRRIENVQIYWERTIEPWSAGDFSDELTGCDLLQIDRYGKWMIFRLSSGKSVLIHLRMAGGFDVTEGAFKRGPYDRLVLKLSDGLYLHYRDTRKFGRWKLLDDPSVVLDKLGPDALTAAFTLDGFVGALKRHKRMVKPLLLDQAIVAGLGNIYVDEALWESKIHPERLSNSLTTSEVALLHNKIVDVLEIGVRNRGTSLGHTKTNYRDLEGQAGDNRSVVKVYGRKGQACSRCGSEIQKIVVAQRGTHFCPVCQKI